MPQSLADIVVHIIFSTKDRASVLTPEIRPELYPYLATIARKAGGECFRVGGISDHVHIAVRLSRTVTIAHLIEDLKTSSSKWLKAQGRDRFSWQKGYAAFSVGPKDLPALKNYIDRQEEHHRTRTFQEEYRAFLDQNCVEYDERYIWD